MQSQHATSRSRPWYTDGSVVLDVRSTLFRVHQSILATYSEIFKDMFTLPQAQDQEETSIMEGCPIVHMADNATDIRLVLEWMYNKRWAAKIVLGISTAD
jgi:hypothetical protein